MAHILTIGLAFGEEFSMLPSRRRVTSSPVQRSDAFTGDTSMSGEEGISVRAWTRMGGVDLGKDLLRREGDRRKTPH